MLEGSRLQRLEELSRQRLEVLIHKDSTPRMKHIHLHDGELLIDHQFAKTPETGGELALTDRRLIFAPWRFTALREMLGDYVSPRQPGSWSSGFWSAPGSAIGLRPIPARGIRSWPQSTPPSRPAPEVKP
jgi:hypothetical protein